jgi:hypothetical protein
MPITSTAGRLLVDSALPEPLRDRSRVLNKKATSELLTRMAREHPEEYRDVLFDLGRLGHQASFWSGGNSFGLAHMRQASGGMAMRAELAEKVKSIYRNPNLSDRQKEEMAVELASGYQDKLEKSIFDESVAEKNPLAAQVVSGARGNKMNLRSIRGADLLYVDHRNRAIPVPILRSYSQGLTPAEYYAGTFGARKGVLDTKSAVSEAGFAAKQLVQMAHRLLVTDKDADEYDGVLRGIPVPTDDPDNEGALLAHDVGGFPRNTTLTADVLARLKEQDINRIVVRSPMVGGPSSGGVYGRDVGVREKGYVAPTGDFAGIAAAQSLSEPLTQATLGSKHSGGVAGAAKGVSGFKLVDKLIQVPKAFVGGAAHAQLDGRVQAIQPAPQGGTYITVNGQRHHLAQGYDPLVKRGDDVEAGDVLSDGIPNPAEIVKHKGVGEGRRYFMDVFRDAYKRSGITTNRRNIELVARGLIDHVRLTDEMDHYSPDDIVSYSRLEHNWKPREGTTAVTPARGAGMYLEKPVLHYSIGTKLRPSVIKELQHFKVDQVHAHPDAPPFEPEMIRGMETLTHDEDWMTRFLGAYVKKNFLAGVHRGDKSDEAGTSYVPSLARGVSFNSQTNLVHGYKPEPRQDAVPAPTPPPATTTLHRAPSPTQTPLPFDRPAPPSLYSSFKSASISGDRPLEPGRTDDDDADDSASARARDHALPGHVLDGRTA